MNSPRGQRFWKNSSGARTTLSRRWEKVIIAFGCNVGNCPENIEKALNLLGERVVIRKVSKIYITEPYGVKNQPPFHNGVLIGYTRLTPYRLLRFLKRIEKLVGRRERCRWCEREIDLDIVYYGCLKMSFEDLKIPHPDRLNRVFVLKPLLEIEPTFFDPFVVRGIKELLKPLECSLYG